MPKQSTIQSWDEESEKNLQELRLKVQEFNSKAKNKDGVKVLQTILKKTKSDGTSYFLIQNRKQHIPEHKFIADADYSDKIKELQSKNYSKARIAHELNISLYNVNKILKLNIA